MVEQRQVISPLPSRIECLLWLYNKRVGSLAGEKAVIESECQEAVGTREGDDDQEIARIARDDEERRQAAVGDGEKEEDGKKAEKRGEAWDLLCWDEVHGGCTWADAGAKPKHRAMAQSGVAADAVDRGKGLRPCWIGLAQV